MGPDDIGVSPDDDFEIDLGLLDLGLPEAPSDEGGLNLDFADGLDDVLVDDVVIDLGVLEEPEPEPEAPEGLDADEEAIVEQLREDVAARFGDWYVVHTYSGMENRVKQNLDNRVKTLGMEDYIFETVVPTEEVMETRNGAKKAVTRTVLPGYVLVRMDMSDSSWAVVRHTPSVTGFVAHANAPVPLTLDEVVRLLTPAALARAAAASAGPKRRMKKVEINDFAVGDSVMVTSGPFAGIHATITETNPKGERIRALVEILGRETPVDLTYSQIQKV